ncbi:conserved Plasmodium protein, unknown function [Plasmodium ovale]|uniref:Uncharacterized protein n=1 Tax=Plasmodium ovale TaxID=36330 RepID=A0A1C3L5M9_PLAOA|nr:conserved Plasmodium protein, unknown function [Plasmodium ovale]
MQDTDEILNFLLHLRERDYTQEYRKDCLSLLSIDENSEIGIGKLLEGGNYSVNDFFLFSLHQCGYINKFVNYKDDDNYKKIVAYILKYGINFKVKKTICKNLLIFSNDYKNRYEPLINSIVSFLYDNFYYKNFCLFILSTLINITNNNGKLKYELIKLNISQLANFLILSKDYDIINKIILLYINLSKELYMCDDIINNGLITHFLDILFNIYFINIKLKKEICINILCIIGQIINYKKYYLFILNYYNGLIEVAIYIYQTANITEFNKIKLIFFFKQIAQYSYLIKDKICKHIFPLIIKEIYIFVDKNFIFSSLNLLNVICDYKINCLYLSQMKIFSLFDFIKSLNIIDLHKKVSLIENKVRKSLRVVS